MLTQRERTRWLVNTARLVVLVFSAVVFASLGSALATEEPATEGDSGRDRVLAEGRVVFEANCIVCHQSDGEGLSGVFPPLADNDHVLDTDYLVGVITQGREGELTVAGTVYDGVMPAFSALSEDQISVLTVYVQEGLGAAIPVTPAAPASAPPSSGLPFPTILAAIAGFGVAGVGLVVVAGPVAVAKRSGGTFSSIQVWLKALAIFFYFVIATVLVPSLLVDSSFLASPPSFYEDVFSGDSWGTIRDMIGAGVWLGALLLGLWALRRAQREDVI